MKNVEFDLPKLVPPREAGGAWTLAEDWRVLWRDGSFALPAGFGTDGASIPRALWRVCGTPLDVPRLYAALVHDWLYSGGVPCTTRAEADAAYRDMQVALGVSRAKAWAEWAALRLFGASHWEASDDAAAKPLRVVMVCALLAALLSGCVTKTRSVDLDGLYVSEAGTLAIGSVEVMAAPQGEESASIRYAEDTAWLSPTTKTHAIKIQLTGTNSVASAKRIVSDICAAFVAAKEMAFVPSATDESAVTDK